MMELGAGHSQESTTASLLHTMDGQQFLSQEVSSSGLHMSRKATTSTKASGDMQTKEISMSMPDLTSSMVILVILMRRRLAIVTLADKRDKQIFWRLWVRRHLTFSMRHSSKIVHQERNQSSV